MKKNIYNDHDKDENHSNGNIDDGDGRSYTDSDSVYDRVREKFPLYPLISR